MVNVSIVVSVFVASRDSDGVVMASGHKDGLRGGVVVTWHPYAMLRGVRYAATEVDIDDSTVSRTVAGVTVVIAVLTVAAIVVGSVGGLRRRSGCRRSITAVGLVLALVAIRVIVIRRLAIHVRAISRSLSLNWARDECDGEQGDRSEGDFDDAL